MKTKYFIFSIFFLTFSAWPSWAATPENLFKKDFPNVKFQSFKSSQVPGVYEIVVDGRVIYYSPAANSIILGQIISKDGKNYTKDKELELLSAKLKELPLDKALKFGEGKNTVIEFTDPDCPYCRQAEEFLSSRSDITKYVFFVPLPSHTDSVPKIRYIFCSRDKKKAFDEAMSGKLDEMKFETCSDPKVDELLKSHEQIAAKMNITATPMFFINGVPVRGADIQAMEKLLTK